jgi:ribonucleotide monophosphatase NagD (HAD superfamily)
MRPESREYGLKHGHSPIAEKVVCIDYDGTLFPWGELFAYNQPLPGAVEAMKRLKEAGFTIVIFTSRLSPTWLEAEGQSEIVQRQYIQRQLDKYLIPWDYITSEKVPAVAYVDDKAIFFEGDNWRRIASVLVGRHGR